METAEKDKDTQFWLGVCRARQVQFGLLLLSVMSQLRRGGLGWYVPLMAGFVKLVQLSYKSGHGLEHWWAVEEGCPACQIFFFLGGVEEPAAEAYEFPACD